MNTTGAEEFKKFKEWHESQGGRGVVTIPPESQR